MSDVASGIANGPTSDFEVLSDQSSGGTTPVSLTHINPMTGSASPGSITDITLEQALVRVRDLSKENAELQNYLRENNEMMKKQFETLSNWKQKVHDANRTNREKFDQTKALILGLRKDKEDLQESLTSQEMKIQERENELLTRLRTLETAKATSEQVAISLKRQAEEQGMSMTEPDINIQETVLVTLSAEKEEMFHDMEDKVMKMESDIIDLKDLVARREQEVKQFRDSADQLLKDIESTQAIKEEIQKEKAQLSEENFQLQQRLHGLLLSEGTNSLRLVGLKSAHNDNELGMKADPESDEVTQLIDQLQREKKRHEQEISQSKTKLQEQVQKEKQTLEKLRTSEQDKRNLEERHEKEIAKLNREHEQKMMEFSRQHDTEKEQQLQSVASTHDNDVQTLRSQVLTLISEVHETQTKLAAATSTLEKKEQRIKDGEQKVQNLLQERNYQHQESERIMNSLQIGIETTRKNWEQERTEHEKTKYHFHEMQKSFNQLVDDYKELLDTFEQFKQDQTQQAQQQNQSDRLSELTAQMMAADETIKARQEQIQKLNAEKQRLIDEYQEMECVYKEQALIYKNDFDAERMARERQVSEKEQILQEMQELQVNNQRLMDELESLSRRQMTDMQRTNQNNPHGYLMVGSPGHRQAHGYDYPGPASPGILPTARPADQTRIGAVAGQLPPTPFQNTQQGTAQNPQGSTNPYQSYPTEPIQHEDEELFCPQCNLQLPDMDSLQIHVVECLDKYEEFGGQT